MFECVPKGVELALEVVRVAGYLLACEVGGPVVERLGGMVGVDRVGDSVWFKHQSCFLS